MHMLTQAVQVSEKLQSFFPLTIKGVELLALNQGIHFTYTLDTHLHPKAGKQTHMHIYSVFKLGRYRNGGNDFCIINEPGLILILIENVLSSSALAHLSSPSTQVV